MTKANILVVEDNERNLKLVRDLLQLRGYRTLEAGTAERGLSLAAEHRPGLILMDVQLPDMDGVTVCRQIRAVRATPIIILTARDTLSDRITGLDAGADDYVIKPFSFDELLARVREVTRCATSSGSSR